LTRRRGAQKASSRRTALRLSGRSRQKGLRVVSATTADGLRAYPDMAFTFETMT
jgi:hypothetical protein